MNPSSFGSLLPVDDAFGASVEAVLNGRAERQLMASAKGLSNWGSPSDVGAMALAQLAQSLGVVKVGGGRCEWGSHSCSFTAALMDGGPLQCKQRGAFTLAHIPMPQCYVM
jgi:hypothetical protein